MGITYECTRDGDLKVTWDADDRQEHLLDCAFNALGLKIFLLDTDEALAAGIDAALDVAEYSDFSDIMEPLITNDSYEWLDASEVGALTSAPILGYGVERDEADTVYGIEHVYWYPQYEVRSPMDDFILRGYTIFTNGDM